MGVARINGERLPRDVVVIGASAGGFRPLMEIISALPANLGAVVGVVVHRGARASTGWDRVFGRRAVIRVVEPEDGAVLEHGCVYIAPPDRHMLFRSGVVRLDPGPKEHHTRPAVDPLFVSAAQTYGPRVLSIVLSGCGDDGVRGVLEVKARGGVALVQDPTEAEQPAMPDSVIRCDPVDGVLSAREVAAVIERLSRGHAIEVRCAELAAGGSQPLWLMARSLPDDA